MPKAEVKLTIFPFFSVSLVAVINTRSILFQNGTNGMKKTIQRTIDQVGIKLECQTCLETATH